MTKPIDEVWIADDGHGWGNIRQSWRDGEFEPRIGELNTPERRRLAAQAQAMARLLLDMHERGSFDGCHDESAVDAVLREAGVIE